MPKRPRRRRKGPPSRPKRPAVCTPTEHAERRSWEFFTAYIRDPKSRLACLTAVRQFAGWCEPRDLTLDQLRLMLVVAYIKELTRERSSATVRQHLQALRMLFDWLVVGQFLPFKPASSVRGRKHIAKSGKAPDPLRQGDPGPPRRD